MSVEALNAVRAHRFGSVSRKMLMYVLADYAAADWSTYVGQARLAGETELGERTVRRLLASLERDGLIRRQARYGATLGRRTDLLVLVAAAIANLPASVAARKPTAQLATYRPLAPDLPATGARPTGQAVAGQEPTVNLTEPSGARARGGDPRKVGDVLLRLVAAGGR